MDQNILNSLINDLRAAQDAALSTLLERNVQLRQALLQAQVENEELRKLVEASTPVSLDDAPAV